MKCCTTYICIYIIWLYVYNDSGYACYAVCSWCCGVHIGPSYRYAKCVRSFFYQLGIYVWPSSALLVVGRPEHHHICLLGAFCLGLFLVVNKNLHMFVCMLSSSFTTDIARQQCCCFISMISCYVVVLLLVVCFCFACIHCFPFIMLALFVFVCFAINAQFWCFLTK